MKLNEPFLAGLKEIFPPTPAPDVRLIAAPTLDSWGTPPGTWPPETWKTWLDISPELLDRAESLLSHFTPEDIIYFIPRFIVQFLTEVSGIASGRFSSATESLVTHLYLWKAREFKDFLLTPDQMRMFEEVLAFALTFPELRALVE